MRYLSTDSRFGFVAGLLVAISVIGCRQEAIETRRPAAHELFTDAAERAGLHFKLDPGAKLKFIETTGSGCAFFDFDHDGFIDVLLIQAGPVPGQPATSKRSRLFRNLGNGKFADITDGSGLEHAEYGQGVAIGDFGNDGFEDVFITGYGGNRLFRNEQGSGKFADVTERAGLTDTEFGSRWATSAAFGDFDGDGWLDLYVCHYVRWSPSADKVCRNAAGRQDYCSPEVYDADTHRLYRNKRDGTFADVTKRAGIDREQGRGLAVAWLDFNGDGKEDIYVANDLSPAFLWKNNGNGTFDNVALEAGCAYDDHGGLMSGMGIGVGDYNRSAHESLFVTNFSGKPNCLFRNERGARFREVSFAAGVAQPHLKFLAFGCEFFDYDADGWLDIIVANGHVQRHINELTEGITLRERKQLFHNNQRGEFEEVTHDLGALAPPRVSRGLAVGDFDNDGRLDVLVNNQNDAPQLLRNNDRSGNHWFSLKLIGSRSNRSGRHAKVTVRTKRGAQYGESRSGSSYLAHSDSRLYFGLDDGDRAEEVTVRWHNGVVDRVTNLASDRFYWVQEGKGIVRSQAPARSRN